MSNWLNFGHADPLTLHMAHPLAERLEIMARPKASRLAGLGVTLACLMGGVALTAPLAAAENHPYKGLTDVEETSLPTTTIRSKSIHKSDGEEIHIDAHGGDVKAWKIEPDGTKIEIDLDDLDEIVELDYLEEITELDEVIEDGFEIRVEKNGTIHLGDADPDSFKRFEFWENNKFPNWSDEEIAQWKSDVKDQFRKNKQAEIGRYFRGPDAPTPPRPPVVTFHKGGLDTLMLEAETQSADAMLEAAEEMIKEAEARAADQSKIRKAKSELKRARRALKEARKALEDE